MIEDYLDFDQNMDQIKDYFLAHTKLEFKALKRSRDMASVLGPHRIFSFERTTNFRVSLKGSLYHLSFAYVYGHNNNNTIETALIGTCNKVVYVDSLDYGDILVHEDTLDACLKEVERVENLLNTFANKIKNTWFNYKKKKQAATVIQRAYRHARDNPNYKLCEQIQMRHMDDIGYVFSN